MLKDAPSLIMNVAGHMTYCPLLIVNLACHMTHWSIDDPHDVRNGASSTIFHHDPQISVLEVTTVVLDDVLTALMCV